MNRYLMAAVLSLVALATAYGVRTQDGFRSAVNDARRTVSSVPTSAAEGQTGIESAGQNVLRQTSEEGLQRLRDQPAAVGQTTPMDPTPPATETDVETEPATFPDPDIPAAPVTPQPQPADQDAIPALW